jgi:hypothetical protein
MLAMTILAGQGGLAKPASSGPLFVPRDLVSKMAPLSFVSSEIRLSFQGRIYRYSAIASSWRKLSE